MPKITDEDLAIIVSSEITAAEANDRAEFRDSRERALAYFLGDMKDTPAEDGRSHAKTSDLADVVEWMLPGIMRVFAGSDRMVDFEPETERDEEFADQASDYVNYVFNKDGNGYAVLWDAIHDALVTRQGIIKFWWDTSPEYTVERYTGLDDDTLAAVSGDDEIEVLAQTDYPGEPEPGPVDPRTGQPAGMVVPTLHDVKIRRVARRGRYMQASVPLEEFLMNSGATDPQKDARFLCHKTTKTRSWLIEQGYSKTQINGLNAADEGDTLGDDGLPMVRDQDTLDTPASKTDKSMEEIDYYEAYLQADVDGDGVAEWVQVIMAGGTTAEHVLDWEEWTDPVPFVQLDPMRVPHRRVGRSVADSTLDVQQIKTVLLRQTLDNIYAQNHPQKAVVEKEIVNPDEVISPSFNGVIRLKGNMPAQAAMTTLVPQFIAETSFQMMQFMDDLIERRTGVSKSTMALDPEALQNQTATAVNAAQSAQYSKIELVARNFALGGLADLFRGVLKILVTHQDKARMIRLRDKWVPMDPRSWNAGMDVTVNTGLGTGSRERDLQMLMQVYGAQKDLLASIGGQFGPQVAMMFVKPEQVYNTLSKAVEAAGLRNADLFFSRVTEQEIGQFMAQQPQQPDPKMVEVQGKQRLAQQQAQLDHDKHVANAQSTMQIESAKLAQQAELERARMAQDLMLQREKMQMENATRLQEMELEAQLKLHQINTRAAEPGQTNIQRPQ